MTRRIFLSLLFYGALLIPVARGDTVAVLQPAHSAQIETLVSQTMSRHGIPGMSVAIATGNELRYANGFGLSDVENSVPARADTLFRTGSVAKPITAVVVLSLMQDGKINLDEQVQKYCPDFPEKRWPVTSRQLLGHLGGIRHYRSRDEASATSHFSDLKSALDVFARDPLLHEPGSKFLYSTFGYNLLGSIVEGATQQRFAESLQHRVFHPAGMNSTRVDDHFAVIPGRARGYIRPTEKALQQFPPGHRFQPRELYNSTLHDTSMKIPGGGLLSTSPDLVRFAIAVNQRRLLHDETVQQMWTRQRSSDGKETEYGLGWRIEQRQGNRLVSHSGGQSGTSTYLLLLPDEGVVVAAMCNLQNTNLKEFAQSLADVVAKVP